jgi:hypothetical protein
MCLTDAAGTKYQQVVARLHPVVGVNQAPYLWFGDAFYGIKVEVIQLLA